MSPPPTSSETTAAAAAAPNEDGKGADASVSPARRSTEAHLGGIQAPLTCTPPTVADGGEVVYELTQGDATYELRVNLPSTSALRSAKITIGGQLYTESQVNGPDHKLLVRQRFGAAFFGSPHEIDLSIQNDNVTGTIDGQPIVPESLPAMAAGSLALASGAPLPVWGDTPSADAQASAIWSFFQPCLRAPLMPIPPFPPPSVNGCLLDEDLECSIPYVDCLHAVPSCPFPPTSACLTLRAEEIATCTKQLDNCVAYDLGTLANGECCDPSYGGGFCCDGTACEPPSPAQYSSQQCSSGFQTDQAHCCIAYNGGQTCQNDSQCCRDGTPTAIHTCANGACCGSLGACCTSDAQCCGGLALQCAGPSITNSATGAATCTACCLANGQTGCSHDGDCCNSAGAASPGNYRCVGARIPGIGTCLIEPGQGSGGSGSTGCTTNSDCADGVPCTNVNGTGTCCVPTGSSPPGGKGADCCPGLTLGGGVCLAGPGGACSSSSQCLSGDCGDGGTCCVPNQGPCTPGSANPCCGAPNFQCVNNSTAEDGGTDYLCLVPVIPNSTGTGPGGTGCNTSADCQYGAPCNGGVCGCTISGGNTSPGNCNPFNGQQYTPCCAGPGFPPVQCCESPPGAAWQCLSPGPTPPATDCMLN